MDAATSDAKFERYLLAYQEHGVSRWAVEDADGVFVGYAGVMPRLLADHPLGPHYEVGWRFIRRVWGRGYATESASAALEHAFKHCGLKEIVSYTSPDNLRSQSVMARLKLQRDPLRDFAAEYEATGLWQGLVWATWPDVFAGDSHT